MVNNITYTGDYVLDRLFWQLDRRIVIEHGWSDALRKSLRIINMAQNVNWQLEYFDHLWYVGLLNSRISLWWTKNCDIDAESSAIALVRFVALLISPLSDSTYMGS